MSLFSKKKRELMGDLPPPPPVNDFSDRMHNINELPPMPPVEDSSFSKAPKEIRSNDLPSLPPPPRMVGEDMKLPDMPSLGDLEKELPEAPNFKDFENDLPEIKEYEPLDASVEEEPIPVRPSMINNDELFAQKKQEMIKSGPVFMRIEDYKTALESIKTIKSRIKDAEDSIRKLNEIKESEDKLFEKFRVQLEDLQRKSNYVDKSLFEGGIKR